MPPTAEPLLSRIARWNRELRYTDIPEPVLEKARSQIMSVLASVYAGRVLEASSGVLRAVRVLQKGQDATLLATGEKSSLEGAILANTSMSMAHDFDDYLFMGHTGHSAVLVSLALCEAYGKRVSDLITCQVAANELAGRLGASALLGPLNGQMWSFIHLLSSSCITGRILDLGQRRMEHAVAIALSQPLYPSAAGFFGSGTKLLTAAWPSVLGLQAAFFAAEGMTGPDRTFDGKYGFYKTFSFYPILGAWDALGERWLTESLAVKRHPGCAYIDSALDAMESILDQYEKEKGRSIHASDIDEIRVSTTLLTCEMEKLSSECGEDKLPMSLNFSLCRTLAWRLLTHSLNAHDLTEKAVSREAVGVADLAARIHVVSDPAWNRALIASLLVKAGLRDLSWEMGPRGLLSIVRKASDQVRILEHLPTGKQFLELLSKLRVRGDLPKGLWKWFSSREASAWGPRHRRFSLARVRPEDIEFPFASTVVIFLRDGSRLRCEQRTPVGAPGNQERNQRDVARAKFKDAADRLLGADRSNLALRTLETLPPETRISSIMPLLCGGKRSGGAP
jgi:2-methylcitrate dehydratase PrpD